VSSQTVLFQAPNRIGLGHMSRLIAIALALQRAAPGIRTPFIVEGEGHGLIETYGLPQINLPSRHELGESGRWSAWPEMERNHLMLDTAATLLRGFAPELVVFDVFPHPAVLKVAIRQGIPVVLSLRASKSLDRHFDFLQRREAAMSLILIPHEEGAVDVPAPLRSRTRFVGTIVRSPPPHEDGGSASAAANIGHRTVIISGGGGGHPGTADFYNLAIEAFGHARTREPDLNVVLVTGPLFKEWWDLRLAEHVRVIPFEPAMACAFARAGLVVCQAGYNTVAELVALGVPAIAVPAERRWDDQFARAASVARSCSTFQMYDGHDAQALGLLMLDTLERGRTGRTEAPAISAISADDNGGAARAAACLLEVLAASGSSRSVRSAAD
jgi:UDP-N-acetylglucosamine--N-acetylmuramyl-(pentapeptide) pyrophosphoryl-undecaprenol N-acetylglucosamine transferase